MANMYDKSVSNWEPKSSGSDNKEKLLSPNAVENQDMANGTNKLEQLKAPSSKSDYGTLGRQAKDF